MFYLLSFYVIYMCFTALLLIGNNTVQYQYTASGSVYSKWMRSAITLMNALFVALVAICVAFFYFNLYPTELKLNRDSSLHTCSAQNQGIAPGYPPDTSPLDYSLLEIFFQKNSKETLKWGTYRSGLYYGLRSRTYPYFVSAGLLWQSQHEDLSQMRHLCRQEDRLQKYGWLKHDGKTFGMQIIEDQHNRLQLKTFYTRFLPKENEQINGWGTRIQVTHLEPIKKNERFQRIQVSKTKLSLFFYIDLGCEDDSLEHTCRDILKDLIEPVTNDPIECSQEKSTSKDTSFTCQQMEFISHGAATSNSSTNPQLSIFEFHTIFQLRTKKKNDMIQSELRFTGLKNVNLLNVREKLIQLGTIDPLAEDQFTKEIYLDNMIEDGSTMIIVQAIIEVNDLKQFQIEEDVQLDILFHENSKISPSSVALFSSNINQFFTKKIEKESKHFDTKFDQVFQLSTLSSLSVSSRQIFNKSQILFAQAAFSNLMGGIGFFYGSSLVHFSMNPPLFQEKNQVIEIAPKPLFTAVPSRSFFPRGFLWDEGFHQMGIYPFDLEITQDVIVHWMRVMLQDGYIPREQILGNLARSRVPKEFLVQHETHANPPSLILCIEKILRTNNKDKIVPFLKLVFPFLKRWYQWLIMTQRGPSEMPGTFRWRGRSLDDGKLIANTLSSGLDDYPRASVPSEKEIHVDLVAWMIKLSDVLAKISVILDPKDPLKQVYLENKERFLQALEKYHWHEEAQTYYDYGLHSEDGRIESQVVVRCRNEAGQIKDTTATIQDVQRGLVECPSTHPNYLYPLGDGAGGLKMQPIFIAKTTKYQHVQHVGYVSIFPFLLKLLPPDSPRLLSLLNLIRDPKHLWTPFGLRSLSTKDQFYEQENAPGDRPYWRGSLWININYLALDALYHYSHHAKDSAQKTKFQETYAMLRQNIIDTIYREYERTGYLWEQYNGNVYDKAHYGKGQRCHPFSGWTALVVNIMAEKFS